MGYHLLTSRFGDILCPRLISTIFLSKCTNLVKSPSVFVLQDNAFFLKFPMVFKGFILSHLFFQLPCLQFRICICLFFICLCHFLYFSFTSRSIFIATGSDMPEVSVIPCICGLTFVTIYRNFLSGWLVFSL